VLQVAALRHHQAAVSDQSGDRHESEQEHGRQHERLSALIRGEPPHPRDHGAAAVRLR